MGYRKQLSFRTEQLKAMQHTKHYTLGHRKRLGKQIEEQYRQSMQHRLSQAKTIIEKREVVSQANPLFYVFGETRKVFKPYLTYEENHGIK
jgi:predicted GNAT family acetyltransferase